MRFDSRTRRTLREAGLDADATADLDLFSHGSERPVLAGRSLGETVRDRVRLAGGPEGL
ncbi:hypothetical protein ACFQMF_14115 [Halorubrum rutilum]|uniref:Uncharacterized protein n=1 Tax=Halorubrum rutilum TaxID=1364933 RepID=A0ABD6ANT2_9EURY|nr:hypothetical protein [Halorubrum rutilum]